MKKIQSLTGMLDLFKDSDQHHSAEKIYGVDESLIEGEMDNPFYTGAMMNAGGIASLNMDMGGDVSGPGGPKDDMIDAKLSDGEFVMTAKAVENFGNGNRMEGAKKMYQMMNKLDPESETMSEV